MAPVNADIWHWESEKYKLWQRVNNQSYRLSPMQVYRKKNADSLVKWDARDALVLKWAAIQAENHSPSILGVIIERGKVEELNPFIGFMNN